MSSIKYHDACVRAFALNGATRQQLADAIGCSYEGIAAYLRRNEIACVHGSATTKFRPRNEQMSSMYRQGLTLEVIGEHFGVTRERIRQILRRLGVDCAAGGQALVASTRRTAKVNAREARIRAMYRCAGDIRVESTVDQIPMPHPLCDACRRREPRGSPRQRYLMPQVVVIDGSPDCLNRIQPVADGVDIDRVHTNRG